METNILNAQTDHHAPAAHNISTVLSQLSLYESYFGLKEKPFKLTPDPKYLFMSKQHQEALAHLTFGIQENKGFVTITGEVGTGKTTLCRSFLNYLDPNIKAAYIFNPCLTDVELLQNINDELSISSNSDSKKYLIDELNKCLLKEKKAGNKVILVIDEAQNLEPSVLEQLRLLSNLETDTEKLIQIILIGQPELAKLLSRPDLRQLKQRITVNWELLSLDKEETSSYIQHRIKIAGGNGQLTFTRKAMKKIYQYSEGIPRMINVLADRALIIAFALDKRLINPKVIRYAIKDIDQYVIKDIEKNRYKSKKTLMKRVAVISFLFLFLLSLGVFKYLSQKDVQSQLIKADLSSPDSAIAKTKPSTKEPPVLNAKQVSDNLLKQKDAESEIAKSDLSQSDITEKTGSLPDEIPVLYAKNEVVNSLRESEIEFEIAKADTSADDITTNAELPSEETPVLKTKPEFDYLLEEIVDQSRLNAVVEILNVWDLPPLSPNELTRIKFLHLKEKRGLSFFEINANLERLTLFQYPPLLVFQTPLSEKRAFLLLIEIKEDHLTFLFNGEKMRVSTQIAMEAWNGNAYMFWINFENIERISKNGYRAYDVIRLSKRLKVLGYYENNITDKFDDNLENAVINFQKENKLKVDGIVGKETKLVLYNKMGFYKTPQLVNVITD